MKKRLLKIAVTTALTAAFAVPAFANPFSDLPAKHWAYDAVSKLQQAGVVDGYSDNTFKGDKTVTRYEMAQIVSKAMSKSLNSDQKATVDQLSKEFAVELNSMGVKVDGLQNQVDNMVKVSGDARMRYFDNASIGGTNDVTDYRARVTFDGKIGDNLKFNARLSSGNANIEGTANPISMDTANVSFNAIGTKNTVGRQDLKLGNGYLADTQMNGVTSNIGGLKVFAGNTSQSTKIGGTAPTWQRTVGAEYGLNLGGAKVTADYLDVQQPGDHDKIYGLNTTFGVVDGVSGNAEYYKNDTNDAKAYAYGMKLNNYGLSATYRNVEAGAYTAFSGMNATTTNFYDVMKANGFKGMEYQYDKNIDKNAVLTVKYQDFKDQAGNNLDARTSAAVNVKF